MATKSVSKTRVRSRQTRIGRSTSASGCFSTKSSQGRLHSLSFSRPGLLMLGNCSVGFAISGVQFRLLALSTALISLVRTNVLIHRALFPVELCHPNVVHSSYTTKFYFLLTCVIPINVVARVSTTKFKRPQAAGR